MESELKEMLASLDRTGYCQWMKTEGVPIVEGFSVEDVRGLELSARKRRASSRLDLAVGYIPSGCTRRPRRKLTEFISRSRKVAR